MSVSKLGLLENVVMDIHKLRNYLCLDDWSIRRLSAEELMLWNCGDGEDS